MWNAETELKLQDVVWIWKGILLVFIARPTPFVEWYHTICGKAAEKMHLNWEKTQKEWNPGNKSERSGQLYICHLEYLGFKNLFWAWVLKKASFGLLEFWVRDKASKSRNKGHLPHLSPSYWQNIWYFPQILFLSGIFENLKHCLLNLPRLNW